MQDHSQLRFQRLFCIAVAAAMLILSFGSFFILPFTDDLTVFYSDIPKEDIAEFKEEAFVSLDPITSGAALIKMISLSSANSSEIEKVYYAIVENDGGELCICFDMTPHAVFADSRVLRDAHQLTILRGPIVYCAESVDNGADLHSVSVSPDFTYTEEMDESIGLYALTVPCKRRIPDPDEAALYSRRRPRVENGSLRLIPYHAFANRGESDMRVWLFAD